MVCKTRLIKIFWILLIAFLLFMGCASKPKIKSRIEFKFYKYDHSTTQFIRDKDDVKTYEEADGYICLSQQDLKKLAERANK